MGRLTAEEKRELLAHAHSKSRRRDFKRLNRKKYNNFSLKLLEEISELIKVDYPRAKIKADKNLL
ncbi:MAG: hypothetical protein ACPL28_08805 [bacterium]